MKKLISIFLLLLAAISFAQNISEVPIQNISTDNNVTFRLFSTRNMYTFINLNTRNGQMWQVQWDTKGNQIKTPLSLTSRVSSDDEINGRFFLYPTANIYNFILIDQNDGRVWQVQWSAEAKNRIVIPIN